MQRLRKRCKTVGCPNLHHNENGYCDECNEKYKRNHPKKDQEGRASSDKRGYDSRWRKFAKDFLALNPVCAMCGEPAEVCDHKDITADMMMDMWGQFDYDPTHYQALCRKCNGKKGATTDKRLREEYFAEKSRLEELEMTQGECVKKYTLG